MGVPKRTYGLPLKSTLGKVLKTMRKINEENERIKRRYFQYTKEAKRQDQASVDKAATAILRFEASTSYKSFKKFHIEQAIAFKRVLAADKNKRTGKPLSKATVDGILRQVKAFIHWLAGQAGYKSRISYSDAEYFNNSAKDARIAHARRDIPSPSMQQALHAFNLMPEKTELERRNKALFAFLMLTGARDGAIASLRLKHIDLDEGCVYQDARDVNTKNSKTFSTWFYPVDPTYFQCFERWVNFLREHKLFGNDDALFPKPLMGLDDTQGFAVVGLSRDPYSNASRICAVIKDAFTSAGLPSFGPHSFRKTLMLYGDQICPTREDFKAWSMNMGHESVVVSIGSYMPIPTSRQGELIKKMRFCKERL